MLATARVFTSGNSQAIRLPKAFRVNVDEMWIARNERTMAFWDAWHEEWLRFGDEDQAAFLRALNRVPLKIWLLGYPWNGGAIIEHRFGACRS